MVKYSRQREAILNQVKNRGDHPTAETLYAELKPGMPNLSLATVYRNLRKLEELGEITTVTTDGVTRYDCRIEPHAHFFCKECGAMLDLYIDSDDIVKIAQKNFAGEIEGYDLNFYGTCPKCMSKKHA